MIRVMIGNHDETMRKKMEDIVRKQAQCRLVGTYEKGNLLLSGIKDLEPDLVLLNPVMPGLDGIGVIEKIRAEVQYDSVNFILIANAKQTKVLEVLKSRKNVKFFPWENNQSFTLSIHMSNLLSFFSLYHINYEICIHFYSLTQRYVQNMILVLYHEVPFQTYSYVHLHYQ